MKKKLKVGLLAMGMATLSAFSIMGASCNVVQSVKAKFCNHDFGEVATQVDEEATYEKAGFGVFTCEKCGYEEAREIPQLNEKMLPVFASYTGDESGLYTVTVNVVMSLPEYERYHGTPSIYESPADYVTGVVVVDKETVDTYGALNAENLFGDHAIYTVDSNSTDEDKVKLLDVSERVERFNDGKCYAYNQLTFDAESDIDKEYVCLGYIRTGSLEDGYTYEVVDFPDGIQAKDYTFSVKDIVAKDIESGYGVRNFYSFMLEKEVLSEGLITSLKADFGLAESKE